MLLLLHWKDFDLRVQNSSLLTFREATSAIFFLTSLLHACLFTNTSKKDVASAMNSFKILFVQVLSLIVSVSSETQNLTCYQCIKDLNEECSPEHLLPCPKVADRCVTHISKHVDKGYLIKRECGLGPCQFEDDMVNKGLGMSGCDRSKDEYFCVFCCKTDGCNKSGSPRGFFSNKVIAILTSLFSLNKVFL